MSKGSEWRRWDLHVHTASSFDHKYKGEDSDELLVKAWRENNIKAVAITDHFEINATRINNLKELAPEITIFPGVELRTDKGGINIHVVLIFSDRKNVEQLSQDFESIMLRPKENYECESIYWTFEEIKDFVDSNNGFMSIHAGNKSSGIDDKISNNSVLGRAIKQDYAKYIDIFEVGNIKSYDGYKDKVFKQIGEKALIICSDNHDPRDYKFNEKLWIKADLNFDGLRQAIEHPEERIFVGDLPTKLNHEQQDTQYILDKVKITKKEDAKNTFKWFDTNLKFNSSLVSIVGNKGTGKSALSDILGLLGNSENFIDEYSSFLNDKRFNKAPENYAKDYKAQIIWKDKHENIVDNLAESTEDEKQVIQYLPQKYIEKVCSELGNDFQKEINKVIFSYINDDEKLGTTTFEEFIDEKTQKIKIKISNQIENLNSFNEKIIKLENLLKKSYIDDLIKKKSSTESELEREINLKPKKIEAPVETDKVIKNEMEDLNDKIEETKTKIKERRLEVEELKKRKNNIETIQAKMNTEISNVKTYNEYIDNLFLENGYDNAHEFYINIEAPVDKIKNDLKENDRKIKLFEKELKKPDGFNQKLQKLKEDKEKITKQSTMEERAYQKYQDDIESWNKKIYQIEKDPKNENSIYSISNKITYTNNQLQADYEDLLLQRERIVSKIFESKQEIVEIYKSVYLPIDSELENLLTEFDSNISFSTELSFSKEKTTELLQYVNKQYSSSFYGNKKANKNLEKIKNRTILDNSENILEFTRDFIFSCFEKDKPNDFDHLDKVIKNKNYLYQNLFSLDYIEIDYNLTLEGKELTQLSPGERGLVLLVFYLVLSKNKQPIIIDQPEDNLDNQSVFANLVPCIKEAKKRRQIILVTHNPNIAVACDSEQIVVADMNKEKNEISYKSGSIENPSINNHLVDILEGTEPAFDLRRRKYILNDE